MERGTDIFGDLKFRHNYKESATLKKNIFDEREYSDNKGNKVKYSKESWDKMIKTYGNDEKVFSMLLKKVFRGVSLRPFVMRLGFWHILWR